MRKDINKIAIIGPAGSGKTSLSRKLGEQSKSPVLEVDSMVWGPDWTHTDRETLRAGVAEWQSRHDRWIIEAAASRISDLVWVEADLVIWLDLPLRTTWVRVIRRSVGQWVRREPLWHGNRRTIANGLWTIKEQPKIHFFTKRRYPEVLGRLQIDSDKIMRLRTKREIETVFNLLNE